MFRRDNLIGRYINSSSPAISGHVNQNIRLVCSEESAVRPRAAAGPHNVSSSPIAIGQVEFLRTSKVGQFSCEKDDTQVADLGDRPAQRNSQQLAQGGTLARPP